MILPYMTRKKITFSLLSLLQLLANIPLLPLAVCLCGIVALVDNQIFRPIVVLPGEVRLQDALHASSVALLGIDGRARHVGNHGITSTPWVLGSSEWVIPRRWLWEPDITAVAAEMTALKRLGHIFLHNDRTTSGVDKPGALLHL